MDGLNTPTEIPQFGTQTSKEIQEIPQKLTACLKNRSDIETAAIKIVQKSPKNIYLTGNGTSYHACYASCYSFNQIAKIKTIAEISPEFLYLNAPVLHPNEDVVIGISQSGESRHTVSAIQAAKEKGVLTIGITDYPKSTLASLVDVVLLLHAGEEKSILATKTYINTLGILSNLAFHIAFKAKQIDQDAFDTWMEELRSVPMVMTGILSGLKKQIFTIAPYFKFSKFCFVLGAGPDYASALEAGLKLKEGAKVFSQAYTTAEFSHGPITLVDESSWILAIVPPESDPRYQDFLKILEMVKARSATVLGIRSTDITIPLLDIDVAVPKMPTVLQPFLSILPVQLLTVEIAVIKGYNCDKPLNLSKIAPV